MKKLLFIFSSLLLIVLISCSQKNEVVTLDSGLKYFDDSLGTGREVMTDELVTVHFSGWIIQDTSNLFSDWTNEELRKAAMIGNSKLRNQPVKFVVGTNSFIKGVDEAVIGMKIGGIRTIIIPSDLAYGEEGIGPIPPNSDLKLVVELLDVKERIVVEMWDVDSTKLKTTESGLQYSIITEGEGETADSGNVVTVHYSGFLLDGTKFDSSVERDDPFNFFLGMGQVIPGWEEGLKLMKKGSKSRLVIPPELGYGGLSVGTIPPNSILIFDVELVDMQ
jgi:FKBP-type peptidyl-prolyl cis-trans isomerase